MQVRDGYLLSQEWRKKRCCYDTTIRKQKKTSWLSVWCDSWSWSCVVPRVIRESVALWHDENSKLQSACQYLEKTTESVWRNSMAHATGHSILRLKQCYEKRLRMHCVPQFAIPRMIESPSHEWKYIIDLLSQVRSLSFVIVSCIVYHILLFCFLRSGLLMEVSIPFMKDAWIDRTKSFVHSLPTSQQLRQVIAEISNFAFQKFWIFSICQSFSWNMHELTEAKALLFQSLPTAQQLRQAIVELSCG